ncbi:SpoIID/LytB domain-containing protein [Aeromicrobium wangtongii]|uniref:SpoIID/LytB domain-containing protein n=1 Tax=Aeromicrobium wangtongii TaxID=2969247 RepID=UPI0024B57145|nr:SpoIID/LytB domain-containing protein [Aeromicrobium wangtongii]
MLSWRAARRTSTLTIAVVVGVGTLTPSSAHAAGTEVTGAGPGAAAPAVTAPPVDVTSTAVPVVPKARTSAPAAPEAPSAGNLVAELPKTPTAGFRMIGVTWADGPATGVQVEVRTRTAGTWSEWTPLEVEDDDEGGVPGTEPLWVDDADGVAARVTSVSGTPQDVRIATIDPGSADTASSVSGASYAAPLDGVARATTTATSDGAPAYTPQPAIISRSAWGASAGTPCDTPAAGDTTRGVVVHHTAGSNSYTKAQSASIVRAVQAYHVKSRKWCDVGYNFLVDKYGQIFEGRRGGIDRAIRAAHSGNAAVNTYTMGVSMMGNYDKTKPQAALKDAMVKLIGWRMGTTYLPAKGTYSLGGKKLNMIAGHRNVVSTGCPGTYGYAWLSESGGLRDRVAAYLAAYSTPVKAKYTALGTGVTGAIFVGEAKSSAGSRLRAKLVDIYSQGNSAAAFHVSGPIRAEYDRLKSRTGVLGYPASDPATIAGATRQVFAAGRIYQVGSSVHTLQGAIATAYANLGETASALGVPTSSTTTDAAGISRANFATGYITSNAATGQTSAYTSAGGVLSESGSTGATKKPAKVGKITVKAGKHSARLTWGGVAGATSYDICLYASKTSRSCARSVTGVAATTTLVPKLKPTKDTDYYAKIRAVNGSLKGSYSALKGFNLATGAVKKTSTAPAALVPEPAAPTGSANTVTVPASGRITFNGHGYGHGIGMSQYGAQGAAKAGVPYDQILATYYPGTSLAKRSGNIRVLISQDTSDAVDVKPASGLVFRKLTSSYKKSLPTKIGGAKVKNWRIVRVSSRKTQSALQYRTTGGYRGYKNIKWTGDGQFEGPSKISLMLPGGSVVKYRGAIRSAVPSKGSTARDTVNVLPIEHYVRGVIAAEMPATWAPEALKAQAVAARTFGVRSMSPARYYDICSTTACQVYGGASRETATTDAAARATSGQYVSYRGAPALTQFSSSSGGRTAAGSQPYLSAAADPYDGWAGNPNHKWATTVTASKIQKAYPTIGKLRSITITRRTGGGSWGGRVSSMTLVGSRTSKTISGTDARWAFGLKSHWFGFQ